MIKTTVGVEGMMCGMCEAHIKDCIRKNFSIKKVTASAKNNEAVIISEEPVGEDQLHAAIDPTGYTVTTVISEPYEKKKGLFGFGKKS
ncbi:MAG: heavy-metal-associated domain-containing protein [Anaerovoracaceae bacterium]|jgi:copper chaperone CopZ